MDDLWSAMLVGAVQLLAAAMPLTLGLCVATSQ
jgi:hypothetical protein